MPGSGTRMDPLTPTQTHQPAVEICRKCSKIRISKDEDRIFKKHGQEEDDGLDHVFGTPSKTPRSGGGDAAWHEFDMNPLEVLSERDHVLVQKLKDQNAQITSLFSSLRNLTYLAVLVIFVALTIGTWRYFKDDKVQKELEILQNENDELKKDVFHLSKEK